MSRRITMKPKRTNVSTPRAQTASSSEGAALIICLGLLSVMTILSVAFAISMRIERMAARNFADTVRAKQLIHVALVRAFQDINETMRDPAKNPTPTPMPLVYPDWGSLSRGDKAELDVMWSYDPATPPSYANILNGEAMSFVPGDRGDPMDLKLQADSAEPMWITNDIRRGKVSYVVVNTSGLIDVNQTSGSNRLYSTHINEIDISDTPEFIGSSLDTFTSDRELHVRYETVDELAKLNNAIRESEDVSTFNIFSFDVNRDELFLRTPNASGNWWENIDLRRPVPTIGLRDAERYLHPKFNLNSITNAELHVGPAGHINRYAGSDFREGYYNPLRDILAMILPDNERPSDVAWNIINYLDEDRIPQGEGSTPWIHTEGGEPIPMINEIVVEEISAPANTICIGTLDNDIVQQIPIPIGPAYKLSIEIWYPYAPVKVSIEDEFSFKLGIFEQSQNTSIGVTESPQSIPLLRIDDPIEEMQFGTSTEFIIKERILGFHEGGSDQLVPIGDTDGFYFIAQVTKKAGGQDIPVDEAIRNSFHITRQRVFQVNDPRSNGQRKYWVNSSDEGGVLANGADWDPSEGNSLGKMNLTPKRTIRGRPDQPVCDPWTNRGQGLPIYATNGVMRNIAELGHIFRSNLDDEEPGRPHLWYWRTLNLMHKDEGAQLLDVLTVRGNNPPTEGLFCINSRQAEPLKALFHNLQIGVRGADENLDDDYGLQNIINSAIGSPDQNGTVIGELTAIEFTSFTDMFTDADEEDGGGGPLAEAFRLCAPAPKNRRHPSQKDPNDIYKEDTFRHICELITFRQNIFTIILGAQALAPRGGNIVAEKRAVANVYRDAYTGRHFVRSFKWLDD
jgi:hypothetical protein